MFQIKEQDKTPEEEVNELEIIYLIKEFKVGVLALAQLVKNPTAAAEA